MKKWTLIIIAILGIFMINSCKPTTHSKGEPTMPAKHDSTSLPSNSPLDDGQTSFIVLPTENAKEENAMMIEWETRIEKFIQTQDVTKIEFINQHMGTTHIYDSEDSTIIKQWKTLLPKFRCSVVPWKVYVGSGGVTLKFYEGENPFPLFDGYPTTNIIYIGDARNYMLCIDNYDEIIEEFSAALHALGVYIYE